MILPISAIIPTRLRAGALGRTLESLAAQERQPAEIVVVDASEDDATREVCRIAAGRLEGRLKWLRSRTAGAATQRNVGVKRSGKPFVLFVDDDVFFEEDCLGRLFDALQQNRELGGVNSTIINQQYSPPGRFSRVVYGLLDGHGNDSHAGRVIGPAVNFLPEDRDGLPAVVPVEWLNTTCTLYRREALPSPPFPRIFRGYSMCEDLTLSLIVGRKWSLANVREARIYHDSQPGSHKADAREMAAMELLNRHFVMTRVLGRRGWADYLKLALWEAFNMAAIVRQEEHPMVALWDQFAGKAAATKQFITRGGRDH